MIIATCYIQSLNIDEVDTDSSVTLWIGDRCVTPDIVSYIGDDNT